MIEAIISQKIRDQFPGSHVELINESAMHAGPATESHFKLILVSPLFKDLPKVKRHQAVYKVLAQELAGPVHALALHLYSPDEWSSTSGKAPASPECSNKK
jgi:BolA protein